jgi:hypothetical protein
LIATRKKTATKKHGNVSMVLRHPGKGEDYHFTFNSEIDAEKTFVVFKAKSLRLAVRSDLIKRLPNTIFAYVGANYHDWNENYVLPLHFRGSEWTYDSKAEKRITNSQWNAGEATVTICLKPREPILCADGKPLCTAIKFAFDKRFHNLHKAIKEELSLSNRSDIDGMFFESIRSSYKRAAGSRSLANWFLINQMQAALFKLLADVLASPYETIERDFQIQNYDSYNDRQRGVVIKIVDGQRIFPKRVLPKVLLVSTTRRSTNNIENLWIANFVKYLSFICNHIIFELAGFIEEQAQKKAEMVTGYGTRDLERSIRIHKKGLLELTKVLEKLKTISFSFNALVIDSDILQNDHKSAMSYFDKRYQLLRQYKARFKTLLEYTDTSDLAMPFRIEAFNRQYQKWCTFQIIEALKSLGFTQKGELKNDKIYKNPIRGKILDLTLPSLPKIRFKLFYEKKYDWYNRSASYGFVNNENSQVGDKTDYSGKKHNPDIAIELWHEDERSYPLSIIIFDPTLSSTIERIKEKAEYKSALRNYKLFESDGQFSYIVHQSWAVIPGVKGSYSTERPISNTDGRNKTEGALIINPETKHYISSALESILLQNPILREYQNIFS